MAQMTHALTIMVLNELLDEFSFSSQILSWVRAYYSVSVLKTKMDVLSYYPRSFVIPILFVTGGGTHQINDSPRLCLFRCFQHGMVCLAPSDNGIIPVKGEKHCRDEWIGFIFNQKPKGQTTILRSKPIYDENNPPRLQAYTVTRNRYYGFFDLLYTSH